jgi:hypothetical protein
VQEFNAAAILGNDHRESYKQIRPQIANIGIMIWPTAPDIWLEWLAFRLNAETLGAAFLKGAFFKKGQR